MNDTTKMVRGSDKVTFELLSSGEVLVVANNYSEWTTVSLAEGRERIRLLLGAGWRLA